MFGTFQRITGKQLGTSQTVFPKLRENSQAQAKLFSPNYGKTSPDSEKDKQKNNNKKRVVGRLRGISL